MGADEGAGRRQRAPTVRDLLVEEMPGMDHVRPDLEMHGNVRRPRARGQSNRIVEEAFGRADLDQHRR